MPQTDVKSQVEELAVESFEIFCEDIAGMFGIDMESVAQECRVETSKGLAKKYKKLTALITVQSTGVLDGKFHIVIDKEGLFTLAGTIVMLPEKRVQEMRRKGTQKDAEELDDAIGEMGNLLVGSWDRVFRENLPEHGHFLQTGTFLGVPWSEPQENLDISDDEEFMYVPIEITVGSFSAFQCGVIFPDPLFVEKPVPEVVEEAASIPEDTAEVVDEPEVPQVVETPQVPEPAQPEMTEATTEPSVEAEEPEPKLKSPEPKPEEPTASAPDVAEEPDVASSPEAVEQMPQPDPVAATVESEQPEVGGSIDVQKETKGVVTQSIEKMVNSSPSLPGNQIQPFLNGYAKDVMQTTVLWGSPDDSVQQAMTKMQEADAGYIMVGTNGVLEGIVSWVDLIGAVSIYLKPIFAKWRRPADDATLQIKIKVIMTRPVRTAKPDTTLAVIMENMCQHSLRCLPIVDSQGGVQGLVTSFDIFQSLLNTDADIATVGRTLQGGLAE